MAKADQFDEGRLTEADLTAVRVTAWAFHDARRGSASQAELSGLRVAMYRLWPNPRPSQWDEAASYFLEFCREAGCQEAQVLGLLRGHFPQIPDSSNPTEPDLYSPPATDVLDKIRMAEDSIRRDGSVPHEEAKRRMARWLSHG